MSVKDLCHVCGEPASSRCDSCGGAACDSHYDAGSGLCVECEGGRRFS